MKEEIKQYQGSRRGFLKSSIASSLIAASAMLLSKKTFANDGSESIEIESKIKMAKKVILEFNVKKDTVKPFMQFLERNLENVRNFDGCSQVEVYYNSLEYRMVIDEIWDSVEHHQKYLEFITKNGVMAELGSFLAVEPEIKYFDFVDL